MFSQRGLAQENVCENESCYDELSICMVARKHPYADIGGHAWIEFRSLDNLVLESYGAWPNNDNQWRIFKNAPGDKIRDTFNGVQIEICKRISHDQYIAAVDYIRQYNQSYIDGKKTAGKVGGFLVHNCTDFATEIFKELTDIEFDYTNVFGIAEPDILFDEIEEGNFSCSDCATKITSGTIQPVRPEYQECIKNNHSRATFTSRRVF